MGATQSDTLTINSSGNASFSGAVTADGLTVNGVVDANSFTDVITNTILTASGNLDIDTVLNSRDVTFTQGSNSLMTIGGTGNVNIPNGGLMVGSTTAPSHKIHVQTDTNALTSLINIDNKHSSGSGGALIFTQNSSVKARIKNYFSGGWNLGFDTEDTTDALTIADNGNATFSGSVSAGHSSSLMGYFYESTADQNGNGKPSSVMSLGANTNSVGEGSSLDFAAVWVGSDVYQQLSLIHI